MAQTLPKSSETNCLPSCSSLISNPFQLKLKNSDFSSSKAYPFEDLFEEIQSHDSLCFSEQNDIISLPDIDFLETEPIIIRGNGTVTLFGFSNTFSTDYPKCLNGHVSKEEFDETMSRINNLLRNHHSTNVKWFIVACLCCCCSFGCSLLWSTLILSKRTSTALEKLLSNENKRLYQKLGLKWKLAQKKGSQNQSFLEYILVIEFIPKEHIYSPD